ncbi:unnamed protein product [Closterium sp. NIES-54]
MARGGPRSILQAACLAAVLPGVIALTLLTGTSAQDVPPQETPPPQDAPAEALAQPDNRVCPSPPSTVLMSDCFPSAPLCSPLLPSSPLCSPLLPSSPLCSPLLPCRRHALTAAALRTLPAADLPASVSCEEAPSEPAKFILTDSTLEFKNADGQGEVFLQEIPCQGVERSWFTGQVDAKITWNQWGFEYKQ